MAYRKLSRVALGTRMWSMLKKSNKQTNNQQTNNQQTNGRSHAPSLPYTIMPLGCPIQDGDINEC